MITNGLITNLPITACDAESSKKTRRWGRQLPQKPRAVTLSSAWARARHVALDPLPYACGLTSFGAVRLVPPRHADINKVTRTNTPCLSSSLPPALTHSKYDRYVPARLPLLRHLRSGLPPGLSNVGLALQSKWTPRSGPAAGEKWNVVMAGRLRRDKWISPLI